MNTLQTQITNEDQPMKRLFRELFLIQIQLEKFTDEEFSFNKEIKDLIQVIDRILEILIDMNDC